MEAPTAVESSLGPYSGLPSPSDAIGAGGALRHPAKPLHGPGNRGVFGPPTPCLDTIGISCQFENRGNPRRYWVF